MLAFLERSQYCNSFYSIFKDFQDSYKSQGLFEFENKIQNLIEHLDNPINVKTSLRTSKQMLAFWERSQSCIALKTLNINNDNKKRHMELFTLTYTEGHRFYRGTNTKRDCLEDRPMWVGPLNTATKYGKFIYSYQLTRNVRLLDVSNTIFHADFIAKCNNLYTEEEKGRVLAPLGLPDFQTQMLNVPRMQNGIYPPFQERDMGIKQYIDAKIGYFGGKHRYSYETLDGVKLDHEMAKALKELYPNHDGYVCKNMWPSYHHNGCLLPEVCLFNAISCVRQMGEFDQVFGGGSGGHDDPDDIMNQKIELTEEMKKYGITDINQIIRIIPGKQDCDWWKSTSVVGAGKKKRTMEKKSPSSGL
jgi:hypothetical protein